MNYIQKSTMITPCAGKSSRFPGSKPKWMLTHPDGDIMLVSSIKNLNLENVEKIIITFVKKHIEDSKINIEKIKNRISDLTNKECVFYILEDFTKSQSETVCKTITDNNISGPIFIKDCDNEFKTEVKQTNDICVYKLDNKVKAANKSYVKLDEFGNLIGIAEKKIISDNFCVGGYSFNSAEEFVKSYNFINSIRNIESDKNEIYISHIIQHMIMNNGIFSTSLVEDYNDWGTFDDWINYTRQFKTIFIDLDGTLCLNSSEYYLPEWGTSDGIEKNIDFLNSLFDTGKVKIIITTSRKNLYKEITKEQLERIGVKYHDIIFDLPHACRVLINDFAATNPYPSAVAVNLNRNLDNLSDYIK